MPIKCSKCGVNKGTQPNRLQKLINQYGSKEILDQNYLCRNCKPKKEKVIKPKIRVKEEVEEIDNTNENVVEEKQFEKCDCTF